MKKTSYFLSLSLFLLAFLAAFDLPAWSEVNKKKDNILMVTIDVTLDMENRRIEGKASTELPMEKPVRIHVEGVELERVTLAGQTINPSVEDDSFTVVASGRNRSLRIQFHRDFPPLSPRNGEKNGHTMMGNFIDTKGVVLLDGWCPTLEGLARYELKAAVPAEFEAISEADAVKIESRGKTNIHIFEFSHPRTGLSLVAGPYQVSLKRHKGIEIAAYFFPEDKGLAQKYIDKSRHYLDLYEGLLGPYPFKRFAIVENRAPTGYGLPTYTLLGQEVARLPFIVDTSLGHEILHSWFGNSVYMDPQEGNWSEGLTTYLADRLYEEQKGRGSDYRHRLLVDYQGYVHEDKAMSLAQFKFRTDRASKAVGYGKGAMLFHMLKQEIGEDAFNKALKRFVLDYRFKMAGWSDLKAVFSDTGKKDLSIFFDQWLERKDVPVLTISKGNITYLDSGLQSQKLTIHQGTESPYSLLVPLVLETTSGEVRLSVRVKTEEESVDIETKGRPLCVTLDPDYDLMRKLDSSEFPLVLSRLLGSEHKFFVLPSQRSEIYGKFTVFLKSLGFEEKSIDSLTNSDLNKGALLILGDPAPRLERLTGTIPGPDSGVIITVRENPINPKGVLALIKASSSKELELILRKLTHYGRYSTLRFEDGKLMKKYTADTQNGIRLVLQTEIMGIAASDLSPVDRIINDISEKRVIYVGERHDRFSHHIAQLRIIQELDRLDRNIAVGMEMFQRPFQDVLDRYLDGQIDEKTFLKKSEYLKRWRYDYHLYRPIIEYCKEHAIPILALNLPAEISKKVARKGLESLSDEELKQVSVDLDWSNSVYKIRLRQIFEEHPEGEVKNFDDFYQAQVLWDETMAQSVHDYLNNNPDRQIVVLAGNGHIAFGDGIPSRTYRRGKYDQAIIIANSTCDSLEHDMADFFLFPPVEQPPFSAKLGVILDDKDNKVMLKKVMHNSPAQKAGLKPGDLLLSFDGEPVKDISDLKLALLFKKDVDTAKIEVKRIKRFARDKVLELTVGPFKPLKMSFHHPSKVKN
ncbi:MAG: ChaN family lipoprotein [Deltaproteobacteria bacterium]|nr:ChaN family lipoprotein [Deltaproteobacteria bacterium]